MSLFFLLVLLLCGMESVRPNTNILVFPSQATAVQEVHCMRTSYEQEVVMRTSSSIRISRRNEGSRDEAEIPRRDLDIKDGCSFRRERSHEVQPTSFMFSECIGNET